MHPVIDLFGLALPAYGVFISIGILAMYNLAAFLGKRTDIGENNATTLMVASLFGGFIGAKGLEVVVEGTFSLRSGGVFLGGLIGMGIATVVTARLVKIPLIEALDFMTPIGTVGHFLGRLGCLFAGCCYGVPTTSSLGIHFAHDSVAYAAQAPRRQLHRRRRHGGPFPDTIDRGTV
jgi:phosphatidylglycerol:prolipoprotein diacylglycerol transferase